MRILSIITSFARGGAEVLTSGLNQTWRSDGHDCKIVLITAAERIGRDASTEHSMRRELEKSGVETVCLGLASHRNILAGAFKLRSVIRNWKPDVIHAHTIKGALMSAGASCPIYYTHHTSKLVFPAPLFIILNRIISGYVAIGSECSSVLQPHVSGPITIIPNAATRPINQPEHRRLQPPNIVAMVGNIRPEKNYAMLGDVVRALQQRLGRDKMPTFEIAGAGTLTPLESIVSDMNVMQHVKFLGSTDGPDALFSRASLLFNCSVREGLPLSMIEGAMAGLPLVAPPIGDIPTIVRPGLNGVLTAIGDPNAAADAIHSILTDDKLYRTLSSGSKTIGAEFAIGTCAQRYLDLFQSRDPATQQVKHCD